MCITELKQITPEKFIAVFDDGSELKTTLNTVADYSLYSGRELTESEYEEICEASSLASTKSRALRMIGARAMSQKELMDKLVSKGESVENAEECTQWLQDLHLLNDSEYAAMVVRHYSAKSFGIHRIKNELYRRGVPKELWDEALGQLTENDDKIDRLLRSKLKSESPDRAELKRATDSLLRRGYSWSEVKSALNRLNFDTEEY